MLLRRRYVVPPDAWERLRGELQSVVEASLPNVRRAVEEPDPLVTAVLGKVFSAASNIERSFVTRLGRAAVRLVAPFFEECELFGSGVWHAACRRRTPSGEVYVFTVKTLLGTRTLNSTERQRVEEESTSVPSPVVLSISGVFREKRPRRLGSAYWLDAPRAWQWLSQEPRAYTRFLTVLYEVGEPLREFLREKFWQEYQEYWRRRRTRNR